MQAMARRLLAPLELHRSSGGARLAPGSTPSVHSRTVTEMEGFTRLLWGAVPLTAGGDSSVPWERIRQGLAAGSDPGHPEYWGTPRDHGQRLVELAPLAVALCLVPGEIWTPLDPAVQERVRTYLGAINRLEIWDNNWRLFRVMVNIALERAGGPADRGRMSQDLDRIEQLSVSGGWYTDGPEGPCDFYNSFAFHFYGLLHAGLERQRDPVRAERALQRASSFSADFIHWFTARGDALPYGRSLTYRFAQAAFWGAYAYACVAGAAPAHGWGVVKGLVMRHLRWWMGQPILRGDGILEPGYAYATTSAVEDYISSSSPYWALKTFLPLALPADHPFWTSVEEPLPDLPRRRPQASPGLLLCRDAEHDHVWALAAGPRKAPDFRHGAEKYLKMCYSSHAGFGVPGAGSGLAWSAPDGNLLLSDDGVHFRGRRANEWSELTEHAVTFLWKPWPDVEVTTWLVPAGSWHVRVHRLETERTLVTAEGGFPLGLDEDGASRDLSARHDEGKIVLEGSAGSSALQDLLEPHRKAVRVVAGPGTNLVHRRTAVPTLRRRLAPGTHWLACAARLVPAGATPRAPRAHRAPRVHRTGTGFTVLDAKGAVVHGVVDPSVAKRDESHKVRPASAPSPGRELAAVCAYFNPCHYRSRRENYRRFRQRFARVRIPLITVELAFGDDPFELPPGEDVVQVRARGVMWQKERLLAIGIARLLQEGHRAIAWLDADLEVLDDRWVRKVRAALEEAPLCQAFSRLIYEDRGPRRSCTSLAHGVELSGAPGARIGLSLPGHAWAATADLLGKIELYDAAIVGGADSLMAQAAIADPARAGYTENLERAAAKHGLDGVRKAHYLEWARAFGALVGGRVACVDSVIETMYHGKMAHRGYDQRVRLLAGFDPVTDITRNSQGCLEWASDKPELHQRVRDYFRSRREDDAP